MFSNLTNTPQISCPTSEGDVLLTLTNRIAFLLLCIRAFLDYTFTTKQLDNFIRKNMFFVILIYMII